MPEPESTSPASGWRTLPLTLLCGMAMGCADAVPGVSGGTVALILGFYERLIGSIGQLLGLVRHPRDRAARGAALQALVFLVPLGCGAAAALITATLLLVGHVPGFSTAEEARAAMDELPGLIVNPATAPLVFGFFFGLVLFSVREPWRARKTAAAWHPLLVLLGGGIAVSLSLYQLGSGSEHPLLVLAAGMVAISVMLLPGVSGTLALLVLGMYQPIAASIAKPYNGLVITAFLGGLVVGGATFVPFLRWLLKKHHDPTMALLTGLMAGSLVALWPWKEHYLPKAMPLLGPMRPQLPEGWAATLLPLACMALGGGLIMGFNLIRARRELPR